jgi:uncharacterized protein YcnI
MKPSILLLAAAFAAPLAHAHITLEQTSAPAGAYQKLTFRVGHGCEGSATNGITVLLPEAVTGAKPMPKAGWNVSTTSGPSNAALGAAPGANASAVREVSWKGGPLPDAQYDEFSMQVKLPQVPGKYYFKVLQLCDKGRMDWSDIPAASDVKLKTPAPVLDVVPAAGPVHQH